VPAVPPAAATVWDKRDPSVGPEQPTFTERAISAIPLPYPLACFLLAILLNTPGFLLANLLDTGDLDRALVRTFGENADSSPSVLALLVAFNIGFTFFLLYLVRLTRLGLSSSSKEITPLMRDGEAGFRRIYGLLHARVPLIAIAAAIGLFFLYLSGLRPPTGVAWTIAFAAQVTLSPS